MDTIKIKVDYSGDYKINGMPATTPTTFTWFRDNPVTIETKFERITVTPTADMTITPQIATKSLEFIKDANLKLAKNNIATYVIIDDKYAYRLPIPNKA